MGQDFKNGIRDTQRRCQLLEERCPYADTLVVIVSTTLEEALDTLGGDVDFWRKGVSCAAPNEAPGTLHEDVKFWRNYVSLCKRGRNNIFYEANFRICNSKLGYEGTFRIKICNLKLQNTFKDW